MLALWRRSTAVPTAGGTMTQRSTHKIDDVDSEAGVHIMERAGDGTIGVDTSHLSGPNGVSTSSGLAPKEGSNMGAPEKQQVLLHKTRNGASAVFSSEWTPPATSPSTTSLHDKRPRKILNRDGDDSGRDGNRRSDCASLKSPPAANDNNASYTNDRPALSWWRCGRRGGVGTHRQRMLRVALCLGMGLLGFDVGLRTYWLFGDVDGRYGQSLHAVRSDGPEQVHLAYSGVNAKGNPTGMTVMWATVQVVAPPVVQYGSTRDGLTMKAVGESVKYFDTVHHRVSLENLEPGTRFFYRCGHPFSAAEGAASPAVKEPPTFDAVSKDHSPARKELKAESDVGEGKWSIISSFLTAPNPQRWTGDGPWDIPVTVAVVADMGLVNAGQTFDRLHQLSEKEEVDFVLHVGDISYADDAFLERPFAFGYEEKWDSYMRRVSDEFGTRLPYMVVPGNHEAECHSPTCQTSPRKLRSLGRFQAYNARFRMPSMESGASHGTAMWYSFNLGPAHWVVIDTETDFPEASDDHFTWYPMSNGGFGDQLAWLEEDLARADQERDVRPWVIVSGHRPMYSRVDFTPAGQPGGEAENVRKTFEPLFEMYNVDLYLSGHVHTYERSFPVIDGEVRFSDGSNYGNDQGYKDKLSLPASKHATYDEPAAPVHVVNGAGGNIEGFTKESPILGGEDPEWHALAITMVGGISILKFPSMNEMRSSFLTSNSPGRVLDELTIRRKVTPSAP